MISYQLTDPSGNTTVSQENNTERDSYTRARMMSLWLDLWEERENREVTDVAWEVLQDLLEDTNNYTPPHDVPAQEWNHMFNWTGFGANTPPIASALSLEQHPEPHAELAASINHQQQSVLQSGHEFSQAEPHNQTQENNTERDSYTRARMMSLWLDLWEERENREVMDVAWEVLQDLLEDTKNYTPPHDVPDQEWNQMFNWTGFGADTPPTASALSLEQHPTEPHAELAAPINHQQQSVLQSGHEFRQAEPHNQTQFNNVPTAMHTRHLEVRLAPVGLFKGKMIYGAPGDRVPSPVNVHNSKKRKRESQQDDETPYITKPPNAFMLFTKEQRPYVLASHKSTDSATVNTIIGKKWRALSEKEQEKYCQEAKRLRQLHNQLYPDWSAKENYGQKWKRIRKRGPRDD